MIARKFKIEEFVEMIRKNQIKDSTTIAVYGLLVAMQVKEFA